jgi:toxin YhaV
VNLGEASGWKLVGDQHFVAAFMDLQNRAKIELSLGKAGVHAKLLAAILELTQERIPTNPRSDKYLLGNTLGTRYRTWCRAKFLMRYRLFFRYNSTHRVIIYSWFNSTDTLRKVGSSTDPYVIFQKMLAAGKPPTDFDELLPYSAK